MDLCRRACQAASIQADSAGLRVRTATSGGQFDANRHIDRPDAAADEGRRIRASALSRDDREVPGRDRADAREHDLAAVRVAAQHQRQRELGGFLEARRIVRQKDRRWRGAAREGGDVAGARRPVSNPDEIERLAADRETCPRVLQDLDPARGHRRRHVPIVVMVAEHAEHAVRRRQRAHRVGRRFDEVAVALGGVVSAPGDVVAAEHDEIRPFGHEQAGGRDDQLVRHDRAAVQIGHETDPEPGEGVGQPSDAQRPSA